MAGETEEPAGSGQGVAGLSLEAGDDGIYKGAGRTLLVLPRRAGRETFEHVRFRIRREPEQGQGT